MKTENAPMKKRVGISTITIDVLVALTAVIDFMLIKAMPSYERTNVREMSVMNKRLRKAILYDRPCESYLRAVKKDEDEESC